MHISFLAYGTVWSFVWVFNSTYKLNIREPELAKNNTLDHILIHSKSFLIVSA